LFPPGREPNSRSGAVTTVTLAIQAAAQADIGCRRFAELSRSGSVVALLPGAAGNFVLDLALFGARHEIVVRVSGNEGAGEGETHGGQRRPRRCVDRHGLGEDPVEAGAAEAVPDKLARALGGVAAAPVPAQQPEAKVRLAGDFRLIWAVRRLQDPPADEVASVESDPKAEPGHLACGGDPAPMGPLDLGTRQGAPGEVAHDFGIGVQLDLEYVRTWSLRRDLAIAVRTPFVVLAHAARRSDVVPEAAAVEACEPAPAPREVRHPAAVPSDERTRVPSTPAAPPMSTVLLGRSPAAAMSMSSLDD